MACKCGQDGGGASASTYLSLPIFSPTPGLNHLSGSTCHCCCWGQLIGTQGVHLTISLSGILALLIRCGSLGKHRIMGQQNLLIKWDFFSFFFYYGGKVFANMGVTTLSSSLVAVVPLSAISVDFEYWSFPLAYQVLSVAHIESRHLPHFCNPDVESLTTSVCQQPLV